MAVAAGLVVLPSVAVSQGEEAAEPPSSPGRAEFNLLDLIDNPPPPDQETVVRTLTRSDEVSLQLIWLRVGVKPHYHARHAETVVILRGMGRFRIGEKIFDAAPGDAFMIPSGTVHSFEVTEEGPVAAVTTFSPGFDGKDRVFVEEP
jgi:mannose-6-phosphate isomerase-like protein (cupin superfamily)